ncbi:MAG: tetratricopeptide repeat protein [Gemmatimonadota bacterium]|jgi:tetratricopeptide (TPR) repeat protein
MVDLLGQRSAWVLGVMFVATVSCAHRDRDRTVHTGSESSSAGAATQPAAVEPEPREISIDRANAFDPGANTMARDASQRVVEEGKGFLIAGRPTDAASRFERATRIDPTNGFAYYYLGRARMAAGDRSGAIGVLEKAESLLGPYPEWRDRAASLAESLRGG